MYLLPVTSPSTKAIPFEKAQMKSHYGRWTEHEHQTFLMALQIHGHDWKTVAQYIHTRTPAQVRSHAQKYLDKLIRRSQPTTASAIFWDDLLKAVQVHRVTEQLHEQYQRLKHRLDELDGGKRVANEDTGATNSNKGKGNRGAQRNHGLTSSSTIVEKGPTTSSAAAAAAAAADDLLLLSQELAAACILQNQFHTLKEGTIENIDDENFPPTVQFSSVVTVPSRKRHHLLLFNHGETCGREKSKKILPCSIHHA